MKRTVMVIMMICAVWFGGCIKFQTTSGNSTGSGSITAKQDDNSTTVDVNVDVDVDAKKNINSSSSDTSTVIVLDQNTPLPLSTWYPYKGITTTMGASNNVCIINSRGILPESAGIVNEHLGTSLRGKTLILYFTNTGKSSFHDGLMIRVNADGTLIPPPDSKFPIRGYLPVEETPPNNGVKYRIPDNFNGKLEFVFYQAELKDLQITAYYK